MASGRINRLREIFSNLAASDSISLEKSDKWMEQARIFGDKITQRDTARAFQKFKEEKMDFDTYMNYLTDLAKSKDVDLRELQAKLSNTNTKNLTEQFKDEVTEKADKIMDKVDRMTAHPVAKKASDVAASVYDKTPSLDEIKKQALSKTKAVKSDLQERIPHIDHNVSEKAVQAKQKIEEILPKIEKKIEETATVAKEKLDDLAPNYSKQVQQKADNYIDALAEKAPDVKNIVKETSTVIANSVDEKNHPRLSRLMKKASETTNSIVGHIADRIKGLTKKEREKNKDKE